MKNEKDKLRERIDSLLETPEGKQQKADLRTTADQEFGKKLIAEAFNEAKKALAAELDRMKNMYPHASATQTATTGEPLSVRLGAYSVTLEMKPKELGFEIHGPGGVRKSLTYFANQKVIVLAENRSKNADIELEVMKSVEHLIRLYQANAR